MSGQDRLSGIEAISALLDASHVALAGQLAPLRTSLESAEEPASDAVGRRRARDLLSRLGSEGVFDPIRTLDLRALCLTRETLAFANPLADAVTAIQALVGVSLVVAGNADLRAAWLDAIVTGRAMAAFAMSEPAAGSDVAAMQTAATRNGSAWTLAGEKHLISNAGIADVYLVFAVTRPGQGSRGISAFLVPHDTPGLEFVEAQVMSVPHPLGRMRLHNCRVPSDALVGEIDEGFALGMRVLDRVRPSVGAAACGFAARAIVEAIRHAKGREQFGRPLAAFQLTRDKLARMATDLEAARLLVYRAAWQGDHGDHKITLESAMAKSFATEAAQTIVDAAVQIIGGKGLLIGQPVERLYRAVRALRIYEGATEIQRMIVADQLLGRPST